MPEHKPPKVPCPRCGMLSEFAPGNPWRPFCSERCKLIDLGKWASEEYRVPEPRDVPPDAPPQDKGD